jgi:hypothetical protein
MRRSVFTFLSYVEARLIPSFVQYTELMTFPDGSPSKFYIDYVEDIQNRIAENAALEFSCIWKEHQRLGGAKPRTLLSDLLSERINDLTTVSTLAAAYDTMGTHTFAPHLFIRNSNRATYSMTPVLVGPS